MSKEQDKIKPAYNCIHCKYKKILGITPICTAVNPPKIISDIWTGPPKSCPKRKKIK